MRGSQTDVWLARYLEHRNERHWQAYKQVVRRKKVPSLFAFQPSFDPPDRDMHAAERLMIPFLARETKCSRQADHVRNRFMRRYVAPLERREVMAAAFLIHHPTQASQRNYERADKVLKRAKATARDVRYREFRRCMKRVLPSDLRGISLEGLGTRRSKRLRPTLRVRAVRG